jgi:aquaporin related protein
MNPARSLGPATVNRSFPGYFWIYWVGPGLGSLLACAFYEILGFLHWKDVNVGQDSDGMDIEKQQPALESGMNSVDLTDPHGPSAQQV